MSDVLLELLLVEPWLVGENQAVSEAKDREDLAVVNAFFANRPLKGFHFVTSWRAPMVFDVFLLA